MKTYRELMEDMVHLEEGVYDRGIFKAFFLAGGPGSGKSYVTAKSTGGLGLKIINSDDAFESKLKRAGMSIDLASMDEKEFERAMDIRGRAKNLTSMKQDLALKGRLGLVIDGTGHDFMKIKKQADALRDLGYDTYMIFVNTSLDVAQERNQMRPRKLPENIVSDYWNNVQKNMGKFQDYFGQNKFVLVDNNNATEDVLLKVFKRVSKYVDKPIDNFKAREWIEKELAAKNRLRKEATDYRMTKDSATMQETRLQYDESVWALSIQDAGEGLHYIWAQSRYSEDAVPNELFTDIVDAVVKHQRQYKTYGYMMDAKLRGVDTKPIAMDLKRKLRFKEMHVTAKGDQWVIWKA